MNQSRIAPDYEGWATGICAWLGLILLSIVVGFVIYMN